MKVKLMQFILEETDVLLLDEPTNHLDLPSREELEKTLETFPGTLLFASHDRYFTERWRTGYFYLSRDSTESTDDICRMARAQDAVQPEKTAEERLRLETELQAVLGKLSMMKRGYKGYADLDKVFNELSR